MKVRHVLLAVLLSTIVSTGAFSQQWKRFPDPSGASWTDVAVSSVEPKIIFALARGAQDIPYYTSNGGTTWQSLEGAPLAAGRAQTLIIVPGTKQTVRVVCDRKIVESNDFGRTWVEVSSLPNGSWFRYLQHPTNADVWFVSNNQVLSRSSDAGKTWTEVFKEPTYRLFTITQTPARPSVMILDAYNKFYESRDTGKTWTVFTYTGNGISTVDLVAADQVYPGRYYGYMGGKIVLSVDSARTWTIQLSTNTQGTDGVAQDMAQPGTLYAWGTNIWKSVDKGITWQIADTTHTTRMTASVTGGSLYVGCTQSGIFRQDGSTWSRLDHGMDYLEVRNLIATSDRTWYLQGVNDVITTTDAGDTWRYLTPVKYDQPSGGRFYSFDVSLSNPNRMYAGTNSDIYRSTDGGTTWLGSGYNEPVDHMSIHPTNPDEAVCGGLYNVRRTTDGGMKWVAAPTSYRSVTALARSSVDPRYLLVSTDEDIIGSQDGGATWLARTAISGEVQIMFGDSRSVTTFFAAGTFGLRMTTDHGTTWQDPWKYTTGLSSLAQDPAYPNVLLGTVDSRGTLVRFTIDNAKVDTLYTPDYSATRVGQIEHLMIAGNKIVGGTTNGLFWFDPTPVSVATNNMETVTFDPEEMVRVDLYDLRGTLIHSRIITGSEASHHITSTTNSQSSGLFFEVLTGRRGPTHRLVLGTGL